MIKEDTGGSAFPRGGAYGMTLRDYFAAKAMEALINQNLKDLCRHYSDDASKVVVSIAEASYMFADAMLAERAIVTDGDI